MFSGANDRLGEIGGGHMTIDPLFMAGRHPKRICWLVLDVMVSLLTSTTVYPRVLLCIPTFCCGREQRTLWGLQAMGFSRFLPRLMLQAVINREAE